MWLPLASEVVTALGLQGVCMYVHVLLHVQVHVHAHIHVHVYMYASSMSLEQQLHIAGR